MKYILKYTIWPIIIICLVTLMCIQYVFVTVFFMLWYFKFYKYTWADVSYSENYIISGNKDKKYYVSPDYQCDKNLKATIKRLWTFGDKLSRCENNEHGFMELKK